MIRKIFVQTDFIQRFIGQPLPEEIKNKALKIIEKGADEFWLEIDSKAKKQRQKVLDKLAVQLQSENPKPLKVPKTKIKKEPYFKVGDVLAVKFENEYGVIFVSDYDGEHQSLQGEFVLAYIEKFGFTDKGLELYSLFYKNIQHLPKNDVVV